MKIKNDCFEKDLERITKLKMELTWLGVQDSLCSFKFMCESMQRVEWSTLNDLEMELKWQYVFLKVAWFLCFVSYVLLMMIVGLIFRDLC